MTEISVAYRDSKYYIDDDTIGDFDIKEMFPHLTNRIKEELTLMGIKDGFTITIEKGGEK